MRVRLTILTGLALVALVTGCSTAQVSQGPPAPGDMTNVTPDNTTNRTPVGNTATSQPNPGGLSVAADPKNTETLSAQRPGSLTAVSFARDSSVGFVASKGRILITSDGGRTWGNAQVTPSGPIIGLQVIQANVQGEQHTYAVAWTKTAIYATETGWVFSRIPFAERTTPGLGLSPIKDVQVLPNDKTGGYFLVLVSNGAVWSSNPNGGASWLKRTPPAPVASVAALDPATWYAATSGGVIYKTTDGGNTWTKAFTAPIKQGLGWSAQIQASGNQVAVLYTSPDVATGHQPYVLYESTDGGTTWNALFENQYLKQDYADANSKYDHTASPLAGPFSLLPHGLIAFTGVYPFQNTLATISVITSQGKRVLYAPIGPSANSPGVFGPGGMPVAITSPDATHFFVVGGNGNKAVMEVSTDGGVTWTTK